MDATTFTDTEGRRWSFSVTLLDVANVKTHCGIDVLDLVSPDSEHLAALTADVVKLFEVMAVLLRAQLDDRKLTEEDLARAMDEQVAESASRAMFEAILGFFRPTKAEPLRAAFKKVTAAADKLRDQAVAEANEAIHSPAFDEAVERGLAEAFGPGVTSSN